MLQGRNLTAVATTVIALGAFVSFFVPRSGTLWIFGSGGGVGEGALALLRYARATCIKANTARASCLA